MDIEAEEYYRDDEDLEEEVEDEFGEEFEEEGEQDLDEEDIGEDQVMEGGERGWKEVDASEDGGHDIEPSCVSNGTSKHCFDCSSGHCSCSNDTSLRCVTRPNCLSLLSL